MLQMIYLLIFYSAAGPIISHQNFSDYTDMVLSTENKNGNLGQILQDQIGKKCRDKKGESKIGLSKFWHAKGVSGVPPDLNASCRFARDGIEYFHAQLILFSFIHTSYEPIRRGME